jgi:hypothetical protein
MTTTAPLTQTIEDAAREAQLTILETRQGTDFSGKPTSLFQFGLGTDVNRTQGKSTLTLELSDSFTPAAKADLSDGLRDYLREAAQRLRNPRPDAHVTLAGLPVAFVDFRWPFHLSTSGADTFIVHGVVRLEDGSNSPLHAKVSASMTVTFAEIVPAPEQPYAENFIFNAIRKTLDQGQLEMLKSGNRQPVPVTTRYYSRWQKRFIFADTTEAKRRDFVALKAYWLSGVLGDEQPVWIADPRDAQYLNTTVEDLRATAAHQQTAGLLRISDDFAAPTEQLLALGDHFRERMAEALLLTKPVFNEEMRSGHTNM